MLTNAASGRPGMASGTAGFSAKRVIRESASTPTTPKERLVDRCLEAGYSHVGAAIRVCRNQIGVFHLVNMIARQDKDELGVASPQKVQVLVHGVRRSLVPIILHPLLGRQHIDEFVETAVQEAPPAFQMLNQALRLVLRRHTDAPNARIDAVGQGKIDDPEIAPARYGGFGPLVRQPTKARAAPTNAKRG